jgi:hypothetical protein
VSPSADIDPGSPPAPDEPAAPQRGALAWLKRYGKWILLAMGVVAVTALIRETGPAKVGAVLLGAGAHLPLIVLLEAAWISMDTFAVRALLGEHGKKAPASL